MNNEREFRQRLAGWTIEDAPVGLADRMVREVTSLPQHRPWWLSITNSLETAFSDWRYGLAYKVAGLAVCAIIGLASGLQHRAAGGDVSALAFADAEWMEGI